MIPINVDDSINILLSSKTAGNQSILAVVRDDIGPDHTLRTLTSGGELNLHAPSPLVSGFYLVAVYAWAENGIAEITITYKETQRSPPNALIVVDRVIDHLAPDDDYPQYNYMFKA